PTRGTRHPYYVIRLLNYGLKRKSPFWGGFRAVCVRLLQGSSGVKMVDSQGEKEADFMSRKRN
ncbi:MAG: hypothetical protein ACI30R_07985, partial [Sodaliphilus sp.]